MLAHEPPAGTETEIAAGFDLAPIAGERLFAIAIGSLADSQSSGFAAALVNTAVSPWTVAVAAPNPADE